MIHNSQMTMKLDSKLIITWIALYGNCICDFTFLFVLVIPEKA